MCGSQSRERPKLSAGNVGDPGKGARDLSEIHVLQGWGSVQVVLAVQLWEKQRQTAPVSSPSAPKMCLVAKKKKKKFRVGGAVDDIPFKGNFCED